MLLWIFFDLLAFDEGALIQTRSMYWPHAWMKLPAYELKKLRYNDWLKDDLQGKVHDCMVMAPQLMPALNIACCNQACGWHPTA